MTAGDPDHPFASIPEYYISPDLSGGASTSYDSPFTVGQASMAKAVAGGFAGRPQGPSLAAQLRAWREMRAGQSAPQLDLAKAIADDPELREHVATRLAMHAMGDHMASTGDSTGAQHVGFAKYRELGGRKSFSAFKSDLKRS